MPWRKLERRQLLLGGIAGIATLSRPSGVLAQPAGRTPIRIANASGNINLVLQQLMQQEGILQQFALEPSVTNVADGAKIVGGLIGGDMDVSTMSGFGQVFPAIERGGRMKILAGAMLLPALALFTGRDGIRSLKDLEGKVVGTGSLGSLLHQLTVALLIKKGVDYRQVQFANIGASGDVFRAVSSGTVDAGLGEATFVDQQARYKVRLIPEGHLSTELAEYTYQGAYATDRTIETKRDLIVRALAAYAKLYRFVHTPAAKEAYVRARREILRSTTAEEDEMQWAFLQRYRPYAVDLALSEERLEFMQRLNVELGVQKKVLAFAQVADMSLARDAIRLIGGPG